MNTKTVYSYDPLTGAFAGELVLDESDLSPLEPGVWLVPGSCLEVAPPAGLLADEYAVARDGKWITCQLPAPVAADAAPTVPEMSLPDRIAEIAVLTQRHLDTAARGLRFTDIAEAVSFAADFESPKFYAQGRAFMKLRGQTWTVVEDAIDAASAGTADLPAWDDLLPTLPTLDVEQIEVDRAAMQASVDAQSAAAAQAAASPAPVPAPTAATTGKRKAR